MGRSSADAQFSPNLFSLPVREFNERLATNVFATMWRRRYLVLSGVVLSLLGGLLLLLLLPQKYSSEATVRFDFSRREALALGSAFAPDQASTVVLDAGAMIQSEVRVMSSRPMVRRVVERMGLANDPAYTDSSNGLLQSFLGRAGDFLDLVLTGMASSAPRPTVHDGGEEGRIARAIDAVLSGLKIGIDNRSYLVTITYTSRDPARSALIANAVAEEYLEHRIRAKYETASRTSDWLTVEIQRGDAALREVEEEVSAFRDRTGLLDVGRTDASASIESENVHQQQLRVLTAQLGAARLSRLNEERRLARVQELVNSGGLPSETDIPGSPLISVLLDREAAARREMGELRSRFGARHPDVLQRQTGLAELRSKIDTEVRRAVSVVAGDLAAARRTEEELEARLEAHQHAMIVSKRNETELRNLLARVQTARDRLTSLRHSREQALASREGGPTVASLALPAEPARRPSAPRRSAVLGLALLAGLCSGAAGAAVAERRDSGLRTRGDVDAGLDVRCLGMVPEEPKSDASGLVDGDRYAFREAVYSICASAGLFEPDAGCTVVLVTSSVAGEGKSVLCREMARGLVATGRRVMLVSGMPALSTLRSQQVQPQAAEEAAGSGNHDPAAPSALVILERKRIFRQNADALGVGGFGKLLADARNHFDVIVIEGAPVLLVADSLVLGRLANTVIHVARWGRTKQQVIGAALRRLREHSVAVDGVVLTGVNLRQHSRLQAVDECSFYLREKDFYERLARNHSQVDGPMPKQSTRT